MIKRNFVFTVSLVAMFAVSSAWADAATGNAVGTAHTVYDNSGLNMAESGIAGVTYVNRMVNAAGNSAQKAEAHAASAGASALSAAADAKEAADAADAAALAAQTANNTLANKQDKLVAGSNITIALDGKTISATDTKYSAGSNISLSGTTFNVPTANGTNLGVVKQGTNITISDEGVISVNTTATPAANSTVPLTAGGAHTALGTKQDTISDLAAIRTGAAAGATALQKADITTGTTNGTISVDGTNVSVKGLGTAAYANTTAFDASGAAATAKSEAIADAASKYQAKALVTSQTEMNAAANKAAVYPSASLMESFVNDKTTGLVTGLGDVDSLETTAENVVGAINEVKDTADSALSKANAAVVKAQGDANKNKAVITDASGNITTGTIATGMIADNAVTLAKMASDSVNSAKIVDSSIATADIANGAVTAAKTSGVIGFIPSGSAAATTYAQIWVE